MYIHVHVYTCSAFFLCENISNIIIRPSLEQDVEYKVIYFPGGGNQCKYILCGVHVHTLGRFFVGRGRGTMYITYMYMK